MRYMLTTLILLFPPLSFSDSIMCGPSGNGGYGCNGKYQGKNNNGAEVFTCSDGHFPGKKILFSFGNCYVFLD